MTEKPNDSSAEKGMEDTEKSIYARIHEAILPNGELPASFSVQHHGPDEIAWADGAWDGVCCYHNQLETPDLTLMTQALRLAAANDFEQAEALLPQIFPAGEHSMLAYIADTLKWILAHHEELDANHMYRFARQLLLDARGKEAVKLALSIMELIPVESDEEVRQAVRELAASDEFTLFALFVVSNWENSNEEIFRMAQRVRGWGRIHAVERLAPATGTIRHWLLHEGVDNDVMPEYSALTVAEKIDLLAVVQTVDRNSEDFIAAGNILQALIESDGGPVAGIEEYEQEEELVRSYIDKARLAMPNENIYRVLRTVKLHYEDDEDEALHARAKEAANVLSSASCRRYMSRKAEQGECLRLASQLGIDCSKEIKAAFRKDWRKHHAMLQFLENPDDLAEMTDFFLSAVRDEDLLKPLNTLVGGTGNHVHELLLGKLSGYSPQEERLLLLGLRTPVVRTRLTTLKRLRIWKENGKFTDALREAVDAWKNSETEAKMRFEYQDL